MSTHHSQTPLLLMGVSGSGKTVIGGLLADRLRMPFLDADDLHPAENVQKMRLGRPLTDTDRGPWLHAVAGEIARRARDGQGVVVACSALKRAYRDRLRAACPGLRLVQLAGPPEVIRRRTHRGAIFARWDRLGRRRERHLSHSTGDGGGDPTHTVVVGAPMGGRDCEWT
jgi:carbohydrate kinase (thermoresistant glucokinase family)